MFSQLQESCLSNIFFVASEIADDVLLELMTCMHKHNNYELLGQRVPKKVAKVGMPVKAAFPPSKLRCFRGDVTTDELIKLLREVNAKEISFQDMEAELIRLKEMRMLQDFFVKITSCSSWADAKEK